MSKNIADLRNEYSKKVLDKSHIDQNPLIQFRAWFDEALETNVPEPNAMTLSTVSERGIPSGRIVLLKELTREGFIFYTNYHSSKGKDIQYNSNVSLTFFWPELERQVRIQGNAEMINREQSQQYFQSRPKGSQIGAWVSPQSTIVQNRKILEDRFEKINEKHKNDQVLPIPNQWGGYLVVPFLVEFWQGRQSRLHDRIAFSKNGEEWKIQRLAP